MLHRFFLPPDLFAGETITLPEEIARQVRTVLRLRPGEHIIVLNGQGAEAEVELTAIRREAVSGRVLERRPGTREPHARVTLCQGLLKADLFEWVLQKGTELGVSAFVPMQSQRSLPGLEAVSPAKMTRWQSILREAAEQCGRSLIPTLSQPQPFARLLETLPAGVLALIFWEGAREPSLRSALRVGWDGEQPIYLFIGPRDGLTAEEATLASQYGAQVVTLGPRILRAETAALAAATIVLYECHEMEEMSSTDGLDRV
jgi:16S rRNA (uracil1498-N3)-methyltransferase